MKTNIIKYRFGRLMLHLGCIFCRPNHSGFHLAGILREAREVWPFLR